MSKSQDRRLAIQRGEAIGKADVAAWMDKCHELEAENAKVKKAYESAATSNVTLIQKVALLDAEVERSRSKEREWRDKALGLHDHRSWLDSGDIPDESEMIPMHKLTLKNLNDALGEKDREIEKLNKQLVDACVNCLSQQRVKELEGEVRSYVSLYDGLHSEEEMIDARNNLRAALQEGGK